MDQLDSHFFGVTYHKSVLETFVEVETTCSLDSWHTGWRLDTDGNTCNFVKVIISVHLDTVTQCLRYNFYVFVLLFSYKWLFEPCTQKDGQYGLEHIDDAQHTESSQVLWLHNDFLSANTGDYRPD